MDLKQSCFLCANTGILFVGCPVLFWVTWWPWGCYTILERNSDIPVGSVVVSLLEEQDVLGFHLATVGHYTAVRG